MTNYWQITVTRVQDGNVTESRRIVSNMVVESARNDVLYEGFYAAKQDVLDKHITY